MPETPDDRPRRVIAPLIVSAVAVVVVIVVIVILLIVRNPNEPVGTSSGAVSTSSPLTSVTTEPSRSATPSRSADSPTPARSSSTTSAPEPTASTTQATGDPTPQKTRSPVPIRKSAIIKPGLSAAITRLEAVKGEAQRPGEVAGPAVRFVLTLTNASDTELPLGTTVVNVYYGEAETPADPLSKPGGKPLPASIPPGKTANGTFIFTIPVDDRDNVLITVDYSVDVSVTAFRGSAPTK